PWFVLAERRTPGFLQFFFIHEHFQRFATPVAQRSGPIYYFILVFFAGFLPALPFFFATLKRTRDWRRWKDVDPDAFFFLLWFALMAALAWPRIPPATALHDFSAAAAAAARETGATVVGYQTYIQGLPWALKSPVPVADYTGELEPQFERDPKVRESLFWTREKFWSEWKSGKRVLAIVRR